MNDPMEDAMTTTAHLSISQFDPMHPVMHFDDRFAVEPPVKASQSPSTSGSPDDTLNCASQVAIEQLCPVFS